MAVASNYSIMITPSFAASDEENDWEERDKQQTLALSILALAALFGMVYLIEKSYTPFKLSGNAPTKNRHLPTYLNLYLDYSKSGFYYGSYNNLFAEPKTELRSPFLMMSVNW